jgi:hypothetical protein
MTQVVSLHRATLQQDAGRPHLHNILTAARYALLVPALFLLAVFICGLNLLDLNTDHPKPDAVGQAIGWTGTQAARIVLTKRAPIPTPDMPLETHELDAFYEVGRRGPRPGDLNRRMEALEVKHPTAQSHHPSIRVKEISLPPQPVEHLKEHQPLVGNPIIHKLEKLDKKRKIDQLELQHSDQQLKKAQAQRDAILKYKPERKSEKGKRMSELTMGNAKVFKAAIVKGVDHVQATLSDSKLQKEVEKVVAGNQGGIGA